MNNNKTKLNIKKLKLNWIGIITIFKEMFKSITDYGITSRAIKNKIINLEYWNPREFSCNKHKRIDERPYGGGPGMVMQVKPLVKAIHAAKIKAGKNVKVFFLSPQGKKIDHKNIVDLATNLKIILVCGRYEGIDERIIKKEIDEEISIGDYITSGGELPAMVIIDAIIRILPGALKKRKSFKNDSFYNGILDYPNYTRPKIAYNMEVPKVLLSGNHKKIDEWRFKKSLEKTWIKRPDLIKKINLNSNEKKILNEYKKQFYLKKIKYKK
ncbi:tRNA (guanosine(37)-N1)-methyltransferase TrmD [Buchnera aphidicola]|uniref:tRNA (guanosine(37)-N1)-methyltransferase TrmD n=1 Tax=Buchnera aphidicola TaxID=9 RepID=UPI0034640429